VSYRHHGGGGSALAWTTAAGPVVADSVYDGETYDARLEQSGWDSPGFAEQTARAHPGRLCALSIFHSNSVFVWPVCMGAQGA
jgi:hypothetical protein